MNSKKKWIIWTVVIMLFTNCLTFFAGTKLSFVSKGGEVAISQQDYNTVKQFSKMFQIKDLLEKKYFGKIDENVMVEGAIKGMTASLNDPYTVFMNKKEFSDFQSETTGSFGGIGVTVGTKNGKLTVMAVTKDSPAKKAGIVPGDNIVKVENTEVSGSDMDKAVSLMRGTVGTSVKVTFYREGKGNFEVTLKREVITVNTVSGEILQNNIGYIQISMFDSNTGKNFANELDDLKSKGAKGFILDLRDNPGGLLDECVKVASNFIPSGKTIVSVKDKYGTQDVSKSNGGDAIGMPLVILVNGNTASASEIVSGAIKDYKLGTLVGTKTFGKGIVQDTYNTKNGTALKVTIAKYYSPNGENIQGKGFEPDVNVEYPQNLLNKPYDRNADPQFAKALQVITDKLK